MKVALNITREPLAGITSTNVSLLDNLHESDTTFAGIELNGYRVFKSPVVYRHLSPQWFAHHIISICDFRLGDILKKSRSLKDVERYFKPIIALVRDILKKERPNILLVNGTYFVPWILVVAARKEKIPIVVWYAGVLSREVGHMNPKARRIFGEMERAVVRSAKRVIFPSELCKKIVREEVANIRSVRGGRIVSNPIAPLFTRISPVHSPVERRIAFVGRDTPIKNLEAFSALHKELLKLGWEHEATIVSDLSKKTLKKIPKTIKVIPSMLATELAVFYSTQGLIVSPSRFETFGNVPIEAVCSGIPVLVSENMGCAEVLRESGLDRMVADFSDVRMTAHRVIELCAQSISSRHINNLRKRVDTKYVAHKIVSALK